MSNKNFFLKKKKNTTLFIPNETYKKKIIFLKETYLQHIYLNWGLGREWNFNFISFLIWCFSYKTDTIDTVLMKLSILMKHIHACIHTYEYIHFFVPSLPYKKTQTKRGKRENRKKKSKIITNYTVNVSLLSSVQLHLPCMLQQIVLNIEMKWTCKDNFI